MSHSQNWSAGRNRDRLPVVGCLEQSQKQAEFVRLFREATPYIQGFRTNTFVIVIPGEVIANQPMIDGILQVF